MNRFSQKAMRFWVEMCPRFLPFADAATPELPLSSLLRLSLIQVSVGMSLVLIIAEAGTLMIGVWPTPWATWITQAVQAVFGR